MGLTDIIATIIILFTLIMKKYKNFYTFANNFCLCLIHSSEVLAAENKFLKNATEK